MPRSNQAANLRPVRVDMDSARSRSGLAPCGSFSRVGISVTGRCSGSLRGCTEVALWCFEEPAREPDSVEVVVLRWRPRPVSLNSTICAFGHASRNRRVGRDHELRALACGAPRSPRAVPSRSARRRDSAASGSSSRYRPSPPNGWPRARETIRRGDCRCNGNVSAKAGARSGAKRLPPSTNSAMLKKLCPALRGSSRYAAWSSTGLREESAPSSHAPRHSGKLSPALELAALGREPDRFGE